MQYQILKNLVFSLLIGIICVGSTVAQEPSKSGKKNQRPTKFPTQYDKIIDPTNKSGDPKEAGNAVPPAPKPEAVIPEALIKAVEGLTSEVRNLVGEVKAGNARQQIQSEILRMSRFDLRIDRYEVELKTVRDRLTLLEADYQTLLNSVTPQSLEMQVSRMPYASKSDAIAQVKEANEARLRIVSAERELVKIREAELSGILTGFREASGETEKRLQALEELLRKNDPQAEKPKPDNPDGGKQ